VGLHEYGRLSAGGSGQDCPLYERFVGRALWGEPRFSPRRLQVLAHSAGLTGPLSECFHLADWKPGCWDRDSEEQLFRHNFRK
jgi:hypothetical protein